MRSKPRTLSPVTLIHHIETMKVILSIFCAVQIFICYQKIWPSVFCNLSYIQSHYASSKFSWSLLRRLTSLGGQLNDWCVSVWVPQIILHLKNYVQLRVNWTFSAILKIFERGVHIYYYFQRWSIDCEHQIGNIFHIYWVISDKLKKLVILKFSGAIFIPFRWFFEVDMGHQLF